MTPLHTLPTTQHNQTSRQTTPHCTIQAHLPSTQRNTASTPYILWQCHRYRRHPHQRHWQRRQTAPASSLPAPVSGSTPAEALLVEAAAASSATTAPALGTGHHRRRPPLGRRTGLSDPMFVAAMRPRRWSFSTRKGAASSFGRQRQSAGGKSPEDEGATSAAVCRNQSDPKESTTPRSQRALRFQPQDHLGGVLCCRVSRPGVRGTSGQAVLRTLRGSTRLAIRRSNIINHAGLQPDGSHIAKASKHMCRIAIGTADRVEAPARMERSMSTARARCTARVCLPRSTTRGAR